MKHFKDGCFHKDFDCPETFQSLVNFLKNPLGDVTWRDDETARDVVHIENLKGLNAKELMSGSVNDCISE